MSAKTIRVTVIATILPCLLIVWMLFGAVLPTKAASAKQMQTQSVTQDVGFVTTYWTEKRMKEALPIEAALAKNARYQEMQHETVKTKSVITPAATAIPPSSYGTFPYSTIGKVFFTDSRTGLNYVCSATAVQSTNKSTLDTAGHCIIEGGSGNNYYTNWSFCPQYIDGSCPKGQWTARHYVVSSAWANYGDFANDLGSVVVNTNGSGQTMTDVVGGVGFGANLSRSQTMLALGYPAGSPFNGNRMQSCYGTTINYPAGSPQPLGISCDMTGGSSGGGWLIQVSGVWYVNGHNDFTDSRYSNVMWSPYFGTTAFNIYNYAQGL